MINTSNVIKSSESMAKKRKFLDTIRKIGILHFGKYKYKVKSAKDLPPMEFTNTLAEKEITFNLDKKKKKKR